MKLLINLMTLLMLVNVSANAALLSVSVNENQVTTGEEITASIFLSDIENNILGPELIASFDIDLQFNNDIMTLNTVTFGTALNVFYGSEQQSVATWGNIQLMESSFDFSDDLFAAQNGLTAIKLAEVSFNSKMFGESLFTISSNGIYNDLGTEITNINTQHSIVQVKKATAVSEPNAIILLLLALASMIIIRRR